MSLLEAREKREQARKLLAGGIDPAFAKKENKRQAARNAANTFEAVAREWHENQLSSWTPRHADYVLKRLSLDIFPEIGYLPIADITAPQILDALRKVEKRGAQEIAHRVMQTCGQVFRYAIVTGLAERNPAADLRGALKPVKRSHYAALESSDLPSFLHALEKNDARLYPHTRLAMKLLMLTFVRTSELIASKWEEIDFEEKRWVIPAERMKMRQAHIVPLSTQSLAILEELKELSGNREWVFPSQINPRKHMSNNTILKALERMGYKGQTTGHGFRALAMSTIKEKLGYRHEVIDRQLAHAQRNKVDAAYDSPLFDIQKPIKEALVLPVMGYGLKPICKNEGLVNFQWQDDESGSQWSVVQYVNYLIEPLKDRREQMKKDILTYNFDDVMATRKLEEWLRNIFN